MDENEMPIEYRSEADAYYDLFDFFHNEHNLILINAELDDIIKAVDNFKTKFNGTATEPK
jgi:hypothetical protein